MEISDVRRRLRAEMETARQEAAARRARSDKAAADYEAFLAERAVPVFHQVAAALTGEGHPFKVFTPAGAVRLAAERSSDEYIELALDTSADPPVVLMTSSRGRGRRMVTTERPLRDRAAIEDLTPDDVLDYLIAESVELVQR